MLREVGRVRTQALKEAEYVPCLEEDSQCRDIQQSSGLKSFPVFYTEVQLAGNSVLHASR